VLLLTGVVMVIGEPARELLAFSFWFKMSLVARHDRRRGLSSVTQPEPASVGDIARQQVDDQIARDCHLSGLGRRGGLGPLDRL
jgi:hypothetical protein